MKKIYKCLRCGWIWTARSEAKPKSCPGCKQYKWDIPRLADQIMANEAEEDK